MSEFYSRLLKVRLPSSGRVTSRSQESVPTSGFHATRRSRKQLCLARHALEASTILARSRAEHNRTSRPLFRDPYAFALAESLLQTSELPGETLSRGDTDTVLDAIATKFIDEQLFKGLNLVNMDLRQEYRQVVLLGCGMDTRPYRLLWPEGTIFFEIAPLEVLEQSLRVTKAMGAHTPRGCLLRRVPCSLQAGENFADRLESCGYQADKLSIWGVQGLAGLQMDADLLKDLFTHISLMAAFDSLVIGELPSLAMQTAEDLLAEHSLLGRVISFGSKDANFGLLDSAIKEKALGRSARRLFTCQHKQLSMRQQGTYNAHVQAAEESDEDFFGNFS